MLHRNIHFLDRSMRMLTILKPFHEKVPRKCLKFIEKKNDLQKVNVNSIDSLRSHFSVHYVKFECGERGVRGVLFCSHKVEWRRLTSL